VQPESLEEFRRHNQSAIERLYAQSDATRFGVTEREFSEALHRGYCRRIETGPGFRDAADIEAFLCSLHVADLGLAIACRKGNDDAWREMRKQCGSAIESAARALISNPTHAREIADSLYADLYGLREADGHRASPLDHYHGRSSLRAWLRAVIVRREADFWRGQRALEPIEKIENQVPTDGRVNLDEPDPDRARYLPMLGDALLHAIAALEVRDKLRLSYHYVHGLTLAEIGRLLGEHESTVSRKLSATRDKIKAEVERSLRADHRLSDEEINQCFEYAIGDWAFNLAEALSQAKG
jgi:RNA polymerase sigma-70 factor, ECF subfamily